MPLEPTTTSSQVQQQNNSSSNEIQGGQITTPVRVRRFATIVSNTSPMAGRFQKSSSNSSSNNSSPSSPSTNTTTTNNTQSTTTTSTTPSPRTMKTASPLNTTNNENNNSSSSNGITNNEIIGVSSKVVTQKSSKIGKTTISNNSIEKVTWLSEIAQDDQMLIPSSSSSNNSFNCFKLSCPYIIVGFSKVKYQIVMTVRKGKSSLSSHRRYSEVLKCHQRLGKVMKMSKELLNLFPTKVAFITKNPEKRRKLGFEKYFDLLALEIMTQLETSLSEEWFHQILRIILEDLFDIQFVEDVVNSTMKGSVRSSSSSITPTEIFKDLIENASSSLNLSISLKQMHRSCISLTTLSEHALLASVINGGGSNSNFSNNCSQKITTISELLLTESSEAQPKFLATLFSSDYKKREEYGGSPGYIHRSFEVDSLITDRDEQNTEYQILKLNLNRFGDRQSLDAILQSICSTIDVHIKARNSMLRREIEHLIKTDPMIKQLNEKGERMILEFLEQEFKNVYQSNSESNENYPTCESEMQYIKKTLDSLASVSKQIKELELKSSILFTQLFKAIQSQDKQLIQKTVEQITLKSQAIATTNEKLVEVVKSWLAYMDIHISKKSLEKDEVHTNFILVFLLPMAYSIISNKLSFAPGVMNLYFGLRSSSVTTEFELLSEKDLYVPPSSSSLGNGSNNTSSPSVSNNNNAYDDNDHSYNSNNSGEEISNGNTTTTTAAASSTSNSSSNNSTPTTPSKKSSTKKPNVFDEEQVIPRSLYGTSAIHSLRILTLLSDSQYSAWSYRFVFVKKLWVMIFEEISKEIDDWQNVHYVLHEEERKLTRIFINFKDDSIIDDFFDIEEHTREKLNKTARNLKQSSECYNTEMKQH